MNKTFLLSAILFSIGCSSSATTTVNTTPTPAPQPISTVPNINKEVEKSTWKFAYAPGKYSYSISTKAEIQREGAETQNSSKDENVILEIGSDGNNTVIEPTVDSTAVGCTGKNASLRARAMYILPKLPNNLAKGMTWSDSITTNGCSYMGATTTSLWMRNFIVEGTAKFEGKDVLEIKRNSTVTGKGEGTEGQHHVLIDAAGTDSTSLFIDPANGKFLGSNTSQNMNISVNISSQSVKFKQTAKILVHQP